MGAGGHGSSTLSLLAHIPQNQEGTEHHRKWGLAITLKAHSPYSNPAIPYFLKVIQTKYCHHLGTKHSKPEPSEDISYSTHDSVYGQGAYVEFLFSIFSSGEGEIR